MRKRWGVLFAGITLAWFAAGSGLLPQEREGKTRICLPVPAVERPAPAPVKSPLLAEAYLPKEEPAAEEEEPEIPALRTPVQITAHRGDSAGFPENTLPAFQSALEKGVDWIELDVQQTSDGHLIVFHDDSLRRITGMEGHIWEQSLEELDFYDVGSWKGADFTGTEIPKLWEVLDLSRNKVRLNIEIKENSYELAHPITTQVIKLVEQLGEPEQTLITAYQLSTLQQVKEMNPKIQTALLCESRDRLLYDAAQVDVFSVYAPLVTREIVEKVHASGKKIAAWIVDSEDKAKELAACGVDTVITNDPEKILNCLYGPEGYFTKNSKKS